VAAPGGESGRAPAAKIARRFENARQAHTQGRVAEAIRGYEAILESSPRHIDAMHLLGVALHQMGHHARARPLIEKAVQLDARRPYLHNNLGEVMRALGEFESAARCYQKALALDPRSAMTANNLGMTLYALGRPREALGAFEQALANGGPPAQLYNNLGMVRHALGELEAAIASFQRAAALEPQRAEVQSNLGAALHDAGAFEAADAALELSIRLDPRSAQAHFNLARTRLSEGDLEGAESACRKALALSPREVEFQVTLGAVLRESGRLDEAEKVLAQALEHAPGSASAHNNLGLVHADRGDFEQANQCYRSALEADPAHTKAYLNLAKGQRFRTGEEADLGRIESLLEREGLSERERIDVHFALGKAYDDCGRYEPAFHHFQEGNQRRRAILDYDPRRTVDRVTRLMRVFDRSFFERNAGIGSASDMPIFVVGMPRSGTTLVEQILAAHPEVHGAGELTYLDTLSNNLQARLGGGESYPECARRIDADSARSLADWYLQNLQSRAPGAPRVTDKMPGNFMHVGLIATLMPRARVVLLRRDPMDVCLSIFFTAFAVGQQYAYDLQEIGAHFRECSRLCDHWCRVLPEQVREIQYEQLVQTPEPVVRVLLEHCGLAWDERCLRFHEADRPVHTWSNWQVRQPMYRSSLQRWKNYERHLQPLIEALGDEGACRDVAPIEES
jgi:tetratricopeptide (TPR) repeat protein